MMESAVRVAGEGAGRTEEGEGKEGRLSFGLGHASSHLYHQPHHPKLLRSDAFPSRTASSSPSTDDPAAPVDGRARSPSSPRTFAFPTNGGIGGGGAAVFSHGGVSDTHGAPRALQRPLVSPFESPGLAGDATRQLCSPPFTAAQWQELHRQALIFKYIMASAPVPPELLFTPRPPFPDAPPILNLGRGGDYLNLRFAAAAGGDLEPGRCRRTDGKKWRCSRDVAPGQKYCERHVHRARPRSRKPVELDRRARPAAANAAEAVSTTSGATEHTTPTATTGSSSAAARPCTPSPPGLLPSGADLKFPFQFMVPQDRKLRPLGSSGGGDAEAHAATPQWQLLQSKMGSRGTTSVLQQQQQQQHDDDQLSLNWNSLSDHHCCPFPSADISSLEDLPVPHDRRGTPRLFIDAWSRPHNPFHGVANKDNHRSTDSGTGKISFRTPGNLSTSNLTLSMSGTCGGGGDGEDQVHFQTGIRAADSGSMLAPSWMSPSSPIGGPLAEVLQTTSTSTVSFRDERAAAGRENDAARGGAGLIIDLISKTGCDSGEGTSPREGGAARAFPSPTRVLQRALVSLSDSSSNSSLTFGAGPRSELGLQWASPSN